MGNSVAVSSDGSVLTGGQFSATADFDPGTGTYLLSSAGSADAFVSKLGPDGTFVWAAAWGGAGSDGVQGLSLADDGSVAATGTFDQTADFDPGPGVLERTSTGSYDVSVSWLNATGELQWAQTFGGPGTDVGYDIVAAPDGSVMTVGKVVGTTDFDPAQRSIQYRRRRAAGRHAQQAAAPASSLTASV